ncbi:uncharacterized protein LOC122004301 [Zingiber officinale]|nr:uncharacterized protein LOC122004301 [Zingiber officinale]
MTAALVLQSHPTINIPSICLAQLQSYVPPLVSTGIGLSIEEQHRLQHNQQSFDTFLSRDLAIDEEYLRKMLGERRWRSIHSILFSMRKIVAQRLREKEGDVEQVAKRGAKLEHHLAHLQTKSMAWQVRAKVGQAESTSLRAQL